jgi:hypothetical protein
VKFRNEIRTRFAHYGARCWSEVPGTSPVLALARSCIRPLAATLGTSSAIRYMSTYYGWDACTEFQRGEFRASVRPCPMVRDRPITFPRAGSACRRPSNISSGSGA